MPYLSTSQDVNTRKEEEVFKLKDNLGTRTNGYRVSKDKFRLEIKRSFITNKGMEFWNSLILGLSGQEQVTNCVMDNINL